MMTERRPRPIIGISVCLDAGRIYRPGRDYYYVRASYVAAVEEAAGLPVLVPITARAEVCELLDGLVITGGVDIDPRHYGRTIEAPTELEEERRVESDRRLLARCLELGVPLLAICYGLQLLNVHLGGTLLQQLPSTPVDHGAPGDERCHGIRIEPGSQLAAALGAGEVSLTSAHRQAVDEVAPGLVVTARAADGVVEGLELGADVIAVQWHPEASTEGRLLYRLFADRATRHRDR